MAILGSWGDKTMTKSIWDVLYLLKVLVFAIFFFLYIELSHASIRFSEIDDYATTHNIHDFSVGSVITNYSMWLGILGVIIFLFSALVLLLQLLLSGWIQSAAPAFGNSLEYNSIFSIIISIALIFVPIGIVITFIFGSFFKSRRRIIVKSKEDVVARRPDAVEVK
jgi:hypothetical protein